ncbi:13217_t:CDS:1, partial [Acaulospora colombiana]
LHLVTHTYGQTIIRLEYPELALVGASNARFLIEPKIIMMKSICCYFVKVPGGKRREAIAKSD